MRSIKVILTVLPFLAILGFSPLATLVGIDPVALGNCAITVEDISVELVYSDYWIPSTVLRHVRT